MEKVEKIKEEVQPVTDLGEEAMEVEIKEHTIQSKATVIMFTVYGLLMLLGIGTGYLLSTKGKTTTASPSAATSQGGKVAGISDEKTFKDSAEGKVEKGGMDGEGTHKLIRDGGPSQTVTLISSAVDLDQYDGKKVKVWGQTFAAKKAAWLMDVGKIELKE